MTPRRSPAWATGIETGTEPVGGDRARPGFRAGHAHGPPPRPRGRHVGRARVRAGRGPRARPLRRVVRVLPALGRRRPARHVPRRRERSSSAAAAMGFDVVYLPPIHPIGRAHRKGRNNALDAPSRASRAARGPSAAPKAGTTRCIPSSARSADFDRFVARARTLGLEVALDFAIQCSPDHPWVREHPEWFFHRPDGTIKYAENPPKKYQDIYPVNFYGEDPPAALEGDAAARRVLDRPRRHALPRGQPPHQAGAVLGVADPRGADGAPRGRLPGRGVHAAQDDEGAGQGRLHPVLHVLHLAQQRSSELRDYLHGDHPPPVAEYFRGNLWPNTPDILHETLQHGGPPGLPDAAGAGRHALVASTASTAATSCARTRRSRRAPRST